MEIKSAGRKNRTERRNLSGLEFAGFEVHSTSKDEINEQGNTGDIWGSLILLLMVRNLAVKQIGHGKY
jgi:hypothetical protein